MKADKQNIVPLAIALAAVIATTGAPRARSVDFEKDRMAEAAAQSAKAAKAFDAIMQVPDKVIPTRTLYDAPASSPFRAGATRVPIASMARISFVCGNDAAFI